MPPAWCYLARVGSVAPITATGTAFRARRALLTATSLRPLPRAACLALLALVALASCNDLRDFRGSWAGPRVGDAPPLRVGVGDGATATLDIASLDLHGLAGTLSVTGLVTAAAFEPVPGAEADVLAGITYDGSPLRVYLGFVPVDDGAGDATAVVSLYDEDRVEVRLLRGGSAPVYAIFALTR
jgi:hypothetical protein